jgi:DNA modification methylase
VESVAAGFAGGGAHHIVGTTLVATVAERRDAPDPAVCLAVGVDEVLEQGEITPVEVAFDQLADMTWTDPPYGVNYANSPKDKLRGKHRPILNDNLGEGFEAFLYNACVNIIQVTKGAVYVCMSSSELDTLQRAFRAAGGKWSTFLIWAKNTFTLGRADYQRQYEPILYGWKDGTDRYWCGARDQGDVWFFDKPRKNDLHPTMKPVALVERAIRNSSKTRDIVLGPFGGSGSTLIACEKAGRQARVIELDPKYVDTIIDRWQRFTGDRARHAESGEPSHDQPKKRTPPTARSAVKALPIAISPMRRSRRTSSGTSMR